MRVHNERLNHLQAAVILAMTLDRTLIEGVEPEAFVGTARDAFREIKDAVSGNGSGLVNLDRLLQDQFGVYRGKGEKVRDAVLRRLKQLAASRKLETEYMKKRFEISSRKD